MVRIIAGTLVEVGLGKIKVEDIENIINAKDRKLSRENTSCSWTIFSSSKILNKFTKFIDFS